MKQPREYDVIIVGGGIVGHTLALLLAKHTSLSIAIVERAVDDSDHCVEHHAAATLPTTMRVSALTLMAQRMLQHLAVWDTLTTASQYNVIDKMIVHDNISHATMVFDATPLQEKMLGFVVSNSALLCALQEQRCRYTQITYLSPLTLTILRHGIKTHELHTAEGRVLCGRLLVAADGMHSWLRSASKISSGKILYQQSAIVATIAMETPHNNVAYQWFMGNSVLAFLPLGQPDVDASQLFSIVWSLPKAEAACLLKLDDEQFAAHLLQQIQSAMPSTDLGGITLQSARYAWPLSWQQAHRYIGERIALVGDAAHTMHPLAGQGLTLGLLDAASLAQVITSAWSKQHDIGCLAVLRRYERWRRADNWAMLHGVHVLQWLFASDSAVMQLLRKQGMCMVNRLPCLRHGLVRYATGNRASIPLVARYHVELDGLS